MFSVKIHASRKIRSQGQEWVCRNTDRYWGDSTTERKWWGELPSFLYSTVCRGTRCRSFWRSGQGLLWSSCEFVQLCCLQTLLELSDCGWHSTCPCSLLPAPDVQGPGDLFFGTSWTTVLTMCDFIWSSIFLSIVSSVVQVGAERGVILCTCS